MDYFLVEGGARLSGEIRIPGAKNAALPMMCAALLTEETCTFHNVPEISDIGVLLGIFDYLGAQTSWDKEQKMVKIQAKNIDPSKLKSCEDVKKFRASILMLGPLLARFGECELFAPGGDIIGARSCDIHTKGMETLGAEIVSEGETIHLKYDQKDFATDRLLLTEASVTGTENLSLFIAGSGNAAELFFTAAEPHVCATLKMLQTMGAEIQGIGTHHLKISGSKKLQGGGFTIPPDGILVGTYSIAALLTEGDIKIHNVDHNELLSFYGVLKQTGAQFDMKPNTLHVRKSPNLKAIRKIQTAIFPGFSSDLQSLFGLLLTQCEGESMIFETLYEGRFTYLSELEKMGAKVEFLNVHQAKVFGKTNFVGTEVQSWDLRAGAAMVLAGLIAEGQTKVTNIDYIDRGYEHFAKNLTALGAKITRVEEVLPERQHCGISPDTVGAPALDPHSQRACKSEL